MKIVMGTALACGLSAVLLSQMSVDADPSEKRKCVCVPYYMCNPNSTIDVYGSYLINVKIEESCSGVDVCCDLPENEAEGADGSAQVGTVSGGRPVDPDQQAIAESAVAVSPQALPIEITSYSVDSGAVAIPVKPAGLEGCGLKRVWTEPATDPSTPKDRRPGYASFAEYPWMIALFKPVDGKPSFFCGGSLVAARVVLTAAHCVQGMKADSIMARAGDLDITRSVEPLPHQDRKPTRISIHENFDPGNLRNDVALLFLESPYELNEAVDIVCLQKRNPDAPTDCLATGWGVNSFSDKGLSQAMLKVVSVRLVDRQQCQEKLRTTRLTQYFRLHRSFICAQGLNGRDTCTGDGGGPLVCSGRVGDGRRFVQLGLVSWGIGCDSQTPGVYTSVDRFYPWITRQMADNK